MNSDSVTTALLQSIPLFSDLTSSHIDKLVPICSLRSVREGEEIFREGDTQDFLYVVLEGRVALDIHVPQRGNLRILTIEPREVLGWSSMAEGSTRRTASARTVAPGKLLAIDADKLQSLCQADNLLGYVVMRQVANVIANRLIITRMQLLDMFANPSAEGYHA